MEDRGQPQGGRLLDRVFNGKQEMELELDRVMQEINGIIENAARNQTQRVHRKIAELDRKGYTMRQIEKEVRKMIGERAQWRRALGINVVTSANESTKQAVMGQARQYLVKTWHAHKDERVRASHRRADGQQRNGTSRFRVGVAWLRFPGDPLGPPQEVINCRCHVTYSPSSIFIGRRTPYP